MDALDNSTPYSSSSHRNAFIERASGKEFGSSNSGFVTNNMYFFNYALRY